MRFATFATWRLCENMFPHFGRYFHPFQRLGFARPVFMWRYWTAALAALLVSEHVGGVQSHRRASEDQHGANQHQHDELEAQTSFELLFRLG